MILVVVIVVLLSLGVFGYMYWLADKVDKENKVLSEWNAYQEEIVKNYNQQQFQQFQ